eukprot:3939497-Rhodomonas_salina.3
MSNSFAWKAGDASKEASSSRVDARRVSTTSTASSVHAGPPGASSRPSEKQLTSSTSSDQRRAAMKELLVAGKLSKHLPSREAEIQSNAATRSSGWSLEGMGDTLTACDSLGHAYPRWFAATAETLNEVTGRAWPRALISMRWISCTA